MPTRKLQRKLIRDLQFNLLLKRNDVFDASLGYIISKLRNMFSLNFSLYCFNSRKKNADKIVDGVINIFHNIICMHNCVENIDIDLFCKSTDF